MTRAEKRKRRLVWSKTAPIHAPDFYYYRFGRFVPDGLMRQDGEAPVWDRKLNRELSPEELVRVRDKTLMTETFGLN